MAHLESFGYGNEDVVASLRQTNFVRTQRVVDALLAVDRIEFVPPARRTFAYRMEAQPIVGPSEVPSAYYIATTLVSDVCATG